MIRPRHDRALAFTTGGAGQRPSDVTRPRANTPGLHNVRPQHHHGVLACEAREIEAQYAVRLGDPVSGFFAVVVHGRLQADPIPAAI